MASLRKRAAAGNASRDSKWAAVMANKSMLAGAAQTAANARKQEVTQAMTLQHMRNTGQMDQTRQRGANQLANTTAVGQNQLANTAAVGGENRKTTMMSLTQGHKNAMEASGQDNIYAKEKDNRAFITSAMSQGATMDETAQNAYNTPGAFDPDISGITIPQQQQKQQNPIFIQPKFDKDGVVRPGTGQWTKPPGVQGPSVQTPAAPIPQQKDLVIGEVYSNGQTEMMWDGEKFTPLM